MILLTAVLWAEIAGYGISLFVDVRPSPNALQPAEQVNDAITLSILEIYNEQIRDLLLENTNNKAPGAGEQKKLEVHSRASNRELIF